MAKNYFKRFFVCISTGLILVFSCDSNEETGLRGDFPPLTGEEKSYNIRFRYNIVPTGKITLLETEVNTTVITISLNNIPEGDYLVTIDSGSYLENGKEFIDLGTLDTEVGYFEKEITMDNEGDIVTYQDLIDSDSHLTIFGVFLTGDSELVADMGVNELIGSTLSYQLFGVEDADARGRVDFFERGSGEALARTTYINKTTSEFSPVKLYVGSFESESDTVVAELNSIGPQIAFAEAHLININSGEPIVFTSLYQYDGHIKILLSTSTPGIVLAAANIGIHTE